MSTETLADTTAASEAQAAVEETKVTTEAAKPDDSADAQSEAKASPEPETEQADDEPKQERKSRSGIHRLKAELAQRDAELAELRKSLGTSAPIPGLPPEPKEADYPDFFEFQAQRTAWLATKAALQATAATREREAKIEQEVAREEAAERYQASVAKAASTIPDYQQVMADAVKRNVQGSVELLQEIAVSDKGALINYQLCKPENAGLLRELNQLTGVQLVRAIARLEGQYGWPRARTETKAAPPLSEVKGNAATRNPDNMSYKEFVKFREAGGKIAAGG